MSKQRDSGPAKVVDVMEGYPDGRRTLDPSGKQHSRVKVTSRRVDSAMLNGFIQDHGPRANQHMVMQPQKNDPQHLSSDEDVGGQKKRKMKPLVKSSHEPSVKCAEDVPSKRPRGDVETSSRRVDSVRRQHDSGRVESPEGILVSKATNEANHATPQATLGPISASASAPASAEPCQLGDSIVDLPSEILYLRDPSEIFSIDTWYSEFTDEDRQFLAGFLPESPEFEDPTEVLGDLFESPDLFFGSPVQEFWQRLRRGRYHPHLKPLVDSFHQLVRKKHFQEVREYQEDMVTKLETMKALWESMGKDASLQQKVKVSFTGALVRPSPSNPPAFLGQDTRLVAGGSLIVPPEAGAISALPHQNGQKLNEDTDQKVRSDSHRLKLKRDERNTREVARAVTTDGHHQNAHHAQNDKPPGSPAIQDEDAEENNKQEGLSQDLGFSLPDFLELVASVVFDICQRAGAKGFVLGGDGQRWWPTPKVFHEVSKRYGGCEAFRSQRFRRQELVSTALRVLSSRAPPGTKLWKPFMASRKQGTQWTWCGAAPAPAEEGGESTWEWSLSDKALSKLESRFREYLVASEMEEDAPFDGIANHDSRGVVRSDGEAPKGLLQHPRPVNEEQSIEGMDGLTTLEEKPDVKPNVRTKGQNFSHQSEPGNADISSGLHPGERWKSSTQQIQLLAGRLDGYVVKECGHQQGHDEHENGGDGRDETAEHSAGLDSHVYGKEEDISGMEDDLSDHLMKYTGLPAVSSSMLNLFHEEERMRYQRPSEAFLYSAVDGGKAMVSAVVRPGGRTPGKVRDHSLLLPDRPPGVTILSLVRDAAARLPFAQGSRNDVVMLLRLSQYLTRSPSEAVLNQIVSGAMDRLHYERDPCIRFDSEKKLWLYLHRRRKPEHFRPDGTVSRRPQSSSKRKGSEAELDLEEEELPEPKGRDDKISSKPSVQAKSLKVSRGSAGVIPDEDHGHQRKHSGHLKHAITSEETVGALSGDVGQEMEPRRQGKVSLQPRREDERPLSELTRQDAGRVCASVSVSAGEGQKRGGVNTRGKKDGHKVDGAILPIVPSNGAEHDDHFTNSDKNLSQMPSKHQASDLASGGRMRDAGSDDEPLTNSVAREGRAVAIASRLRVPQPLSSISPSDNKIVGEKKKGGPSRSTDVKATSRCDLVTRGMSKEELRLAVPPPPSVLESEQVRLLQGQLSALQGQLLEVQGQLKQVQGQVEEVKGRPASTGRDDRSTSPGESAQLLRLTSGGREAFSNTSASQEILPKTRSRSPLADAQLSSRDSLEGSSQQSSLELWGHRDGLSGPPRPSPTSLDLTSGKAPLVPTGVPQNFRSAATHHSPIKNPVSANNHTILPSPSGECERGPREQVHLTHSAQLIHGPEESQPMSKGLGGGDTEREVQLSRNRFQLQEQLQQSSLGQSRLQQHGFEPGYHRQQGSFAENLGPTTDQGNYANRFQSIFQKETGSGNLSAMMRLACDPQMPEQQPTQGRVHGQLPSSSWQIQQPLGTHGNIQATSEQLGLQPVLGKPEPLRQDSSVRSTAAEACAVGIQALSNLVPGRSILQGEEQLQWRPHGSQQVQHRHSNDVLVDGKRVALDKEHLPMHGLMKPNLRTCENVAQPSYRAEAELHMVGGLSRHPSGLTHRLAPMEDLNKGISAGELPDGLRLEGSGLRTWDAASGVSQSSAERWAGVGQSVQQTRNFSVLVGDGSSSLEHTERSSQDPQFQPQVSSTLKNSSFSGWETNARLHDPVHKDLQGVANFLGQVLSLPGGVANSLAGSRGSGNWVPNLDRIGSNLNHRSEGLPLDMPPQARLNNPQMAVQNSSSFPSLQAPDTVMRVEQRMVPSQGNEGRTQVSLDWLLAPSRS